MSMRLRYTLVPSARSCGRCRSNPVTNRVLSGTPLHVRSLSSYRPFNALQPFGIGFAERFNKDINDAFSVFNNWPDVGNFRDNFRNAFNLRLDVKETPESYQVVVDVPGIPKDSVKISAENQNLTISVDYKEERSSDTGEHDESKETVESKEKHQDENKMHWRERSVGFATRTIRLPENCDLGKATARQENGVLTITMPKTKAEEHKKYIAIN